jgi:hypothetical protein
MAMINVSWNGATDLARWEILSGPSADRLQPVGSSPSARFETIVPVQPRGPWIVARAFDVAGRVLADSAPMQV